MKRITIFTLLILSALFSIAQEKEPFKMEWNNGYKLTSPDKNFNMKFGGRIMYDAVFFQQDLATRDSIGRYKNGTEFRRIRFFNSGTIYKNVKYKLQFDFAGGSAVAKDMYIELTKIPVVGNIRVGHFKEPMGIERLSSSKYNAFLERTPTVGFLPERNNGIMLHNKYMDSRLTWQAAMFRNGDNYGNDKEADNDYNLNARVTGLPILNEDKNQLLHLGAAVSYRKKVEGEYKIDSRAETHLGPKYISTGTFTDVEKVVVSNAELLAIFGPFSVQCEFFSSSVHTKTDSLSQSSNYTGYYGQVSYFITGESKQYKDGYSCLNRVKPKNNFGNGEGGLGAIEVAVRYSGTDFTNDVVTGGEMGGLTGGINWYLNPAVRLMGNYGYVMLNGIGNTNIFQFRLQVDF